MTENHRPTKWQMILGVVVAAAIGFAIPRGNTPAPSAASNPAPAAAKNSDADAPQTEVKIPEAYLSSADIAVESVTTGDVSREILAPATVTAAPGGEAVLAARATGTIQQVRRQLGDSVQPGDILATVDSLDASSMAAERRVAQAKAALARKTFDRESSLYNQGVTPRQDMEAAEASLDMAEAEAERAAAIARSAHVDADGRTIAIVSPIAGKITAQNVTVGAYVSTDTELFRVAAPGAVQIEASVTALETGRIAAGDDATILLATGSPVAATVRSATPTVSANSRAATVILTPKSPSTALVIGEGVQVRLHSRGGDGNSMTVPEDAVQNVDGRDVLFVRTAEGFRPQPVLVGTRSGGVAQIISGVKAGDRVATRNAFLVKAESSKSAGDEE